jgi:alanine racemase
MSSTRLTRALVDLARLERNWRRLVQVHRGHRVMTVLKANAYGHGLVPCARFLQGLGQPLFGVALLDEALALREAGITGRILVLGPPEPGTLPLYGRHRIEVTLPSLAHLSTAIATAADGAGDAPLEAHLKCDTGMGRIGLQAAALEGVRTLLRDPAFPHGALAVRGVYSHLAEAERLESGFCDVQRAAFERWCGGIAEVLPGAPPERHLANSAGLLRDPALHYDYARVGFALWAPLGFHPPDRAPAANGALEPVLSLVTRVSHAKTLGAGDGVGYSRTYRAQEREVIATLPVGYGDGYFRNLGNRGEVLLAGRRRPIVGTVSMDQTTVSLGQDPCTPGDEAVLLGGSPAQGAAITVAELAAWAGTIDYEVLTHLGARVPREYVYDGRALPTP